MIFVSTTLSRPESLPAAPPINPAAAEGEGGAPAGRQRDDLLSIGFWQSPKVGRFGWALAVVMFRELGRAR